MEHSLTCNNLKCRQDLGDRVLVTSCSHIFCLDCVQLTGIKDQENDQRICPVCETQLNSPDDTMFTNLNPSEDYKSIVMCGLPPNIIMECAGRALSFWTYQASHNISFERHLCKMLNEKYANLTLHLEKTVNEANSEIESLQHRITSLTADQGTLRRKNMELTQAFKEKNRKLLHTQELYDRVKRRAEIGSIQQAASDAVDSSHRATPQLSHGFGVVGDYNVDRGNTVSAFGQSRGLDMAGMNTGQPRSHASLSRDDSRWPRLGGASRPDSSSALMGEPGRHGFASSSLLNRTSSLPALVGTPAPGSGTVRGTTVPSFANNRVGFTGVGLTSGLKVSQPTSNPGLDISTRHH